MDPLVEQAENMGIVSPEANEVPQQENLPSETPPEPTTQEIEERPDDGGTLPDFEYTATTEAARHREVMHETFPDLGFDKQSPRPAGSGAAPTTGESIMWSIQEGVTGQISRLVRNLAEEETPEAQTEIREVLPELMWGVSEEYEDHILAQPNIEAAKREANYLRRQAYRDLARSNEGAGQGMLSGFVGFVADPVNLIPGGVVVKGMTYSSKVAVMAGLKAGETTLMKKGTAWGVAGAVEESVRLVPQLLADPTYQMDEYLQDVAITAAMAAGMPTVGAAFRYGVKRGGSAAARTVDDAAHAMGAATTMRTASVTLDRVADQVEGVSGIRAKFKTLDFGAAIRGARDEAKKQINAKVRELRRLDTGVATRKAVEGANAESVEAAGIQTFEGIAKAVQDRTGVDLNDIIARERETLVKQPEAPRAPDAPEVEAPPYTPREAAKEAIEQSDKAYKAADRVIEASDLPADAKRNLHLQNSRLRKEAMDAVNEGLENKGIIPKRTALNNRTHTDAVDAAVKNVRKAANRAFNAIDAKIEEGGINMPRDVEMPAGTSFGKRGNHAMKQALKHAGIKKGNDETWAEAITRTLFKKDSGKMRSHVQRGRMLNKFSTGFRRAMEDMHSKLDELGLDEDTVMELAEELENARALVEDQIRLAQAIADNPYEDAIVTTAQWTAISDDWAKSVDKTAIHEQYVQSKRHMVTSSQLGPLTSSLSGRLLKSGSNIAGWFATNILEVPAGFGGAMTRSTDTAAIVAEMLDRDAQRAVMQGWDNMMKAQADYAGWNAFRRLKNKQGNARTHEDVQKISKQVMLEVNARQRGQTIENPPHVKEFVDTLTDSYSKLHDIQNGKIRGIHDGNKIKDYMHQSWDNQRFEELLQTPSGRAGLEDLFATGYAQAGLNEKQARTVAKAVIEGKDAANRRTGGARAIGEEDADNMLPGLVEIAKRMRNGGTPEETVVEIMEAINKHAGGETPNYAKSRVPIDISARANIDGKIIQVVDLMEQDVPATFARYSKESTARVAMYDASGGVLDSDKAINEMLVAMGQEAQALGTAVDLTSVETSIRMLMGKKLPHALPSDVRRVRDAVALAMMGGLGESQLAEFGLSIARGFSGMVGLAQKVADVGGRTRRLMGIELTDAQKRDTAFIGELEEASTMFREMAYIERQNVHFDDMESSRSTASRLIEAGTGGKFLPLLQHMQGRVTGYNAIRNFEDQVAMASITQDIAKYFGKRGAFSSEARLRDLGVPTEDASWLRNAFDQHVMYDDKGRVTALNLHEWSARDKQRFGVILNRYAGQQVQKSFVGETSAEMMNPWVAFMMQFKSYQLTAAEKQQGRHLKFADKEAVWSTMLNAASSAGARILRYHSAANAIADEDKRQAYLDQQYEKLHFDTFKYMGIAGMSPNFMEGFSNYATSGEFSVADSIPVFNYLENYAKALGGPVNNVGLDKDLRNVQVVAPMATTMYGNLLFRGLQETLED